MHESGPPGGGHRSRGRFTWLVVSLASLLVLAGGTALVGWPLPGERSPKTSTGTGRDQVVDHPGRSSSDRAPRLGRPSADMVPAGHGSAWLRVATRAARRAGGINDLLARRGRALRSHDRSAFLSTVDPRDVRLRRAQAQMFDRLADLPVVGWQIRVRDRARPRLDSGAAHAGDRFRVPVLVSHRIRGFDDGPVSRPEVMTVVRRGHTWRVAGEHPPGSAARMTHDLWELGDVGAARGAHTLAMGDAPQSTLRRFVSETETGIEHVDSVWHETWSRHVVVLVPGTFADMARVLGEKTQGLRQIAAVTTNSSKADARWAARVVVNPDTFRSLSPVGRRIVLAHELTHEATRGQTTGQTPTWLAEGFADYVGYKDQGVPVRSAAHELLQDVRAGRAPSRLPTPDDFKGTADALGQSYEGAWLACRLIAQRHGEKALVAFYEKVGTLGVPRAFSTVLDTTEKAFTARWRRYVRSYA